MVETRTEKSVRNAKVALIFYLVQILLGFFSRKAFFDYLGSEILGLNTPRGDQKTRYTLYFD